MPQDAPSTNEPPKSATPTPTPQDVPTFAKVASLTPVASTSHHSQQQIFRVVVISLTAILAAVIMFGLLRLLRGSEAAQPGKIVFEDSLTELSRDFLQENLGEALELEADVKISASTSLEKLPDSNEHVLYDILVPVTDFYNPISSIAADEIENYELISVWNLENNVKLLAVDNQYYLDTLESGAKFQYYDLEGNEADLQKVQEKLRDSIASFPTHDTILTFAQTGVTALSRAMNTKLKEVGNASFFAADIADFLSSFDLTHTSNESSFIANAPTTPSGTVICSEPAMIDALTAIGLDIVELTGNHNQDCGDEAASATIDTYHSLGIQTVGGGKTAAEAAVPLRIAEKASAFTLLAYNLSTGGYTLDDTPGANLYTEDKVKSDIAAAKAAGDTVIVDVQYYECNAYVSTTEDTTCDYAGSSAGDQIGFFRELIDMGADIVIGTAAHQPQTYELYGDGAIYYGLGNLFFDQALWPGTSRSLILVHYFYDNRLVQTRIAPTMYDKNYQTHLLDTADAKNFLERLNNARPGA